MRLQSSTRGNAALYLIGVVVLVIAFLIIAAFFAAFFLALVFVVGAVALIAFIPPLRAPPGIAVPLVMILLAGLFFFIGQGQQLSLQVARMVPTVIAQVVSGSP